jgi:hypothetical protein
MFQERANQLTNQYGKGFDKRSLYRFVKFYQLYPEIVGTVSPQSFHSLIHNSLQLKHYPEPGAQL